MLDIIKGWLRSEPTRFVGYGTAAVLQAVLWAATQLNIAVPSEAQSALTVLATFIFTEIVRAIVSSPNTVARISGVRQP